MDYCLLALPDWESQIESEPIHTSYVCI